MKKVTNYGLEQEVCQNLATVTRQKLREKLVFIRNKFTTKSNLAKFQNELVKKTEVYSIMNITCKYRRYSGHRANRINEIVIRLNVWKKLSWLLKRDARQTHANKAALNENVFETLKTV